MPLPTRFQKNRREPQECSPLEMKEPHWAAWRFFLLIFPVGGNEKNTCRFNDITHFKCATGQAGIFVKRPLVHRCGWLLECIHMHNHRQTALEKSTCAAYTHALARTPLPY